MAKVEYDKKYPIQMKDALNENHTTDLDLATASISSSENFALTSLNICSSEKFKSNSMDVDENDVDYDYNDDDYIGNDDDDNDDYFEDEDVDDDDDGGDDDGYDLNLVAQFDDKNLPPGVEATVPWLPMPADSKLGATSSTVSSQPSSSKHYEEKDDEILNKFRDFKHFDTVSDYSDHYFNASNKVSKFSQFFNYITRSSKDCSQGGSLTKTQKDLSKKIQEEWRILENNLPDEIFVRAYEERIDLMRAVIVGPAETPYHDGLFFFDIFFPPDYPAQPPDVHYHAGGLRLNPNLYACGKVCLSLLNTWSGSKNEKWSPRKSTMLQVLVSIQGLVLNAKPYFNEPGYEKSAGKPGGERKSLAYNENTFLLSCKTMLHTLRRPPKHFEDFVAGHFRQRAHAILEACKAYMEGAQVGSPAGARVQGTDEGHESSKTFKTKLGQLFPELLVAFTDNGADCRQFLPREN
ncbi:hypothetical protein AAC387_Pa06g0943 [Persea americana]